MSVEHEPRSNEALTPSSAELQALAPERAELSAETVEQAEKQQENRAEKAREAIKQQTEEPVPAAEKQTGAPTFAARLDHVLNYRQTLASVQRRLAPASRRFSQVIHAPAVEATSEALEKTVMRPSVALGATWTALIIGSCFYFAARHYGFRLSGAELAVSFVVGGIIGWLGELGLRALRRR